MFKLGKKKIPLNRELRFSLQCVRGFGFWKSFLICSKLGFSFPFFASNLNYYFFILIKNIFKMWFISPDKVRRKRSRWRKILRSLNNLKSQRHNDILPVNGQRTRSNAGTFIRRLRDARPLEDLSEEKEDVS